MFKDLYEQLPYIATNGIVLRKISMADLDSLFEIYGNENVVKSIPANTRDRGTLKIMVASSDQDVINEKFVRLGISFLNNVENIVGVGKIYDLDKNRDTVNIGYSIRECFWNQGIATKAIKAMVDFLFSQSGINHIQAFVLPENIKSQNALLKNSFIKENFIKQGHLCEGKGFVDVFLFSLSKSNYLTGIKSI